MADLAVVRRAVSAAQAILRETDSELLIDGKPGTRTLRSYLGAPPHIREAVDKIMFALGSKGMRSENEAYAQAKSEAASAPQGSGDKTIFDLQIVPAVVREARRRAVNPVFYIGQLGLESGWGRSTPHLPDGRPSYNYGGLKQNSVGSAQGVVAATKEQVGSALVGGKASFAVFGSADEFAKSYISYLLDKPRYKGLADAKNPTEFAQVLVRGGYATDANYSNKVVSAIAFAQRTYLAA